jgi:hypothetical protein
MPAAAPAPAQAPAQAPQQPPAPAPRGTKRRAEEVGLEEPEAKKVLTESKIDFTLTAPIDPTDRRQFLVIFAGPEHRSSLEGVRRWSWRPVNESKALQHLVARRNREKQRLALRLPGSGSAKVQSMNKEIALQTKYAALRSDMPPELQDAILGHEKGVPKQTTNEDGVPKRVVEFRMLQETEYRHTVTEIREELRGMPIQIVGYVQPKTWRQRDADTDADISITLPTFRPALKAPSWVPRRAMFSW